MYDICLALHQGLIECIPKFWCNNGSIHIQGLESKIAYLDVLALTKMFNLFTAVVKLATIYMIGGCKCDPSMR